MELRSLFPKLKCQVTWAAIFPYTSSIAVPSRVELSTFVSRNSFGNISQILPHLSLLHQVPANREVKVAHCDNHVAFSAFCHLPTYVPLFLKSSTISLERLHLSYFSALSTRPEWTNPLVCPLRVPPWHSCWLVKQHLHLFNTSETLKPWNIELPVVSLSHHDSTIAIISQLLASIQALILYAFSTILFALK